MFALATVLAALAVGSVSFTVIDASEAVLPGVEVRLVDGAGLVAASVLTDTQGSAQFPRMRAGQYQARVNLDGFAPQVLPVLIAAGALTSGVVKLQVAGVADTFVIEPPRKRTLGPRCTEHGDIVPHP